MKIKCIDNYNGHLDLTMNKAYELLEKGWECVRITDDKGNNRFYNMYLFDFNIQEDIVIEKDFKEVIRDIKEDEVWVGDEYQISNVDGDIIFTNIYRDKSCCVALDKNHKYKKVKTYHAKDGSLDKALAEGKIMRNIIKSGDGFGYCTDIRMNNGIIESYIDMINDWIESKFYTTYDNWIEVNL